MKKLIVLTTGGTIEKVYDEADGALKNGPSIFRENILNHLRLPNYEIQVYEVFSKDSLDIDDLGREFLAQAVALELNRAVPIVIIHGTDTMDLSAEYCLEKLGLPPVPVVFTGAMKPIQMRDSDAFQNVSEAILASQVMEPAYYISFHGQVFKAGECQKDRQRMTFIPK